MAANTKVNVITTKTKKIGELIKCPSCRKYFIKNSVNHRCCSVKCRDRFYNDNREKYRLKIESFLGRKLNENEIVHHINQKNKDNRIQNLWIAPNRKAHGKAHSSINKLVAPLIEANIIKFNKEKGSYELFGD